LVALRSAEVERVLQHGGREGVVDDHRHALGLSDHRGDVDQLEGRVRRGLENDQCRVGAHAGRHLVRVAEGGLGAQEAGREQVIGAAVQGTDGHDVAPSGACGGREDRRGHGRHSGRERDPGLGVLQFGERLLEPGDGGIPEPPIDRAATGQWVATTRHRFVGVAAVLDVGQRIRGREVDRRRVHSEGGEVGAAGMDGCRLEMQSSRFHADSVRLDPRISHTTCRRHNMYG